MKRFSFPLIATTILLQSTSVIAQRKSADPHAPGEDIYKHYTGTIGTRQVTLDLLYGYQGASNYGGSWYYSPENVTSTQFYIQQPSSFNHNVALGAHEQPYDTSLAVDPYVDDKKLAAWNFTINGDKLKGRWKSSDSKRNYSIDLTENYDRSVPLDLFVRRGESSEMRADHAKRTMNIVGIVPGTACGQRDAECINTETLKFLAAGNSPDLKTYYADCIRRYINESSASGMKMMNLTPAYNDNNLLVLKLESLASGFSTDAYLCLDMKSHKRLMPEDMLDVTSAKLPALLESAARKKYGFTPGLKLSTWLVRDKITPTKNFYPGHKGFYFSYNSGELAKNKAVTLFVPYEQVEEMMPRDFRKRVD